jgi:hypothetical protein
MERKGKGWHVPANDKYGNVACVKCGYVQSPSWGACIKCCQHKVLVFRDEWVGLDDGGGWAKSYSCAACGKDFDLDMGNYLIVRQDAVPATLRKIAEDRMPVVKG